MHQDYDSPSSDDISSDGDCDTSFGESSDEARSDTSSNHDSDVLISDDDPSDDSNASSASESDKDKQMMYDGSRKTTDEAVLKLMTLYVRRRWRKSTLQEVLSFNTEFFPSNLPKSVYKLFKYLEDLTPDR